MLKIFQISSIFISNCPGVSMFVRPAEPSQTAYTITECKPSKISLLPEIPSCICVSAGIAATAVNVSSRKRLLAQILQSYQPPGG